MRESILVFNFRILISGNESYDCSTCTTILAVSGTILAVAGGGQAIGSDLLF